MKYIVDFVNSRITTTSKFLSYRVYNLLLYFCNPFMKLLNFHVSTDVLSFKYLGYGSYAYVLATLAHCKNDDMKCIESTL